jgi:ribonuclease D
MPYLTNLNEIREAIARYSQGKTLWLDTEVADYQTPKPRLSLIQILDSSTDLTGEQVTILDVLDKPDLVKEFIDQIMVNPAIEKVFHNAKFDITFLGKRQAKNITCTLELVRKIPYYIVPIPNQKLKTLAQVLCHFPTIDKSEQGGDWGRRPLTDKQLEYASMDPVYTAQVHHRLLQLHQRINSHPESENIPSLTHRYREIFHDWKVLDTEVEHLKERLKKAMEVQQQEKLHGFELSTQNRRTKEVDLQELAEMISTSKIPIKFNIKLTVELQKALAEVLNDLTIKEKVDKILILKIKDNEEDEEIPF